MITVMVTGCGGAIGFSAVKALRMGSEDLRIVGVDADSYSAFFFLSGKKGLLDKTCTVPRADHPDYIAEIINLCRKENVDVLLPCTDAELEKLSASESEVTENGTKIIISPFNTIKICRDKWATYCNLSESLPMVKSALPNMGIEEALQFTGLPAIVKPRKGWGSRNTWKVTSAEEAKIVIGLVSDPIIQEWLAGDEYTVDGLTDRNGKAICVVPRLRAKIFSGLSFQGITIKDKELIQLGKKILKHLKIIGPFNFQVKKVEGEPTIFEINPRFAGTGILSAKAGANIPLLAVKNACNLKIPSKIDFEAGMVVTRYFEEVYFKN